MHLMFCLADFYIEKELQSQIDCELIAFIVLRCDGWIFYVVESSVVEKTAKHDKFKTSMKNSSNFDMTTNEGEGKINSKSYINNMRWEKGKKFNEAFTCADRVKAKIPFFIKFVSCTLIFCNKHHRAFRFVFALKSY